MQHDNHPTHHHRQRQRQRRLNPHNSWPRSWTSSRSSSRTPTSGAARFPIPCMHARRRTTHPNSLMSFCGWPPTTGQNRVPGGRHRQHHRQRHPGGAGGQPHSGEPIAPVLSSNERGLCCAAMRCDAMHVRSQVWLMAPRPRPLRFPLVCLSFHTTQETADAHNLQLGTMLDDAGMVGTATPAGASSLGALSPSGSASGSVSCVGMWWIGSGLTHHFLSSPNRPRSARRGPGRQRPGAALRRPPEVGKEGGEAGRGEEHSVHAGTSTRRRVDKPRLGQIRKTRLRTDGQL